MPSIIKTPRIKVSNLKKSFENNIILRDINFEILAGKSLVIIGGSGSGKSVLIKCISGLLEIDSGVIELDGNTLTNKLNKKRFKKLHLLGYIFQNSALFDSLTVLENVSFGPQHFLKASIKEANEIAFKKLSQVGLNEQTARMYPSELSTGLRKRVAIARAIATKPQIIFFDEPTTGLDPIMSEKINQLILNCVQEEGITALTITHDMESAKIIGDEIAMLYDGRIVWSGPPSEIVETENKIVKQFIHGHTSGPIYIDYASPT